MLDLVEGGSTLDEVIQLAKRLESSGIHIINTGIGWHEARVPTIGSVVPNGGFAWVTKRLMGKVGIPLITTNRINTPEIAESILADGFADMVSMARPFLADPDFVLKAMEGRSNEINTCIACNQACLDHTFEMKISTCIVNPRACHETILNYDPATQIKTIAVFGAGPAGLATATTLAQRGHKVSLFEKSDAIGGQFKMASIIPGKEDYHHTIRYYDQMVKKYGVELHLNFTLNLETFDGSKYDDIIIATGVHPRKVDFEGSDRPEVVSYKDLLSGRVQGAKKVAIVGAGGIGFDVATYLANGQMQEDLDAQIKTYMKSWGVDMNLSLIHI